MNFFEIKKKKNKVYGGIIIDRLFSEKTRKKIRKIFFNTMVVSFCFIFLTVLSQAPIIKEQIIFQVLTTKVYFFRSFFVLFFSIWFFMYLLELMYISYYFKDTSVDFEILKIIDHANPKDITLSFLNSIFGIYTLLRLGISKEEVEKFLQNRTDFVSETEYEIIENDDKEVSLSEFGYSLIHFDSDFRNLLKANGITPKDFKDVLDWISRVNTKTKTNKKWWSKEKFDRIPSIGKNWSFGKIFYLEKFGHSIFDDNSYIYLANKDRIFSNYVKQLENILIKNTGGNVFLISKENEFSMRVIASLGKAIFRGTVLPKLENKRIYVLDVNLLISTYENKNDFEIMLQRILYQSALAGNVILVIPHLSDFVENSNNFGIDVKDILNDVLTSTNIQIIATSSKNGFHSVLETDFDLMRNFEKIVLDDLDFSTTIEFIEDEILFIESEKNIFFTYQSIKQIVLSADRYFSESSLSDKALDILEEVVNYCVLNKKTIVTDAEISEVIKLKTGMELGILTKEEKNKINSFEKILKQKIIGQDLVIESIINTMKRIRLGIANPNKPQGTFLFIGPTGVGKTETCKALAEVFFGDSENMIRIDMSEFNDSNAVWRLIGSKNNQGILSSKIRDKKFGILLLDEIEKADIGVHNLFLQILDEGFFSDFNGERVDLRNFIIIATSNAGSSWIYSSEEEKESFTKEKLIDYLIKENIFYPEFLNRFDEIIFFNLLDKNNLKIIANLMIEKISFRLEDRGIEIKVDEKLLEYLVDKSKNSQFGAREMNRIIQKEIETKIADALMTGDIKKGDTILITTNNLSLEINKIH